MFLNHRDVLIMPFSYYILFIYQIYLYVKPHIEAPSVEWHERNIGELPRLCNAGVYIIIMTSLSVSILRNQLEPHVI